MAKERPHFL